MSRSTEATLTGFKIRVIRQSASPIEHPLEDGRSVFIGRSDSCGIQVKGDGVAEIHCLIDVDHDTVSIQDWASAAGTKINGSLIDDKTSIRVGDSVVIGAVALELIGAPAKNKASTQKEKAAKADDESREESVGMESLGYEEIQEQTTAVADRTPVVRQTVGRLSESFGNSNAPAQEHVDQALISDDLVEAISLPIDNVVDNAIDQHSSDIDDVSLDEDDLDDEFAPNNFSADDLDWDPSAFEDDQIDPEIVQLLKSEIEDLRIQLAERDEQLAASESERASDLNDDALATAASIDHEFGGTELVGRVDDLLAELAEHDERVSTLQELLQTAEIQNQAEREERNCLENWVGEIEQRIGERESEWRAEQDALRDRLTSTSEERDRFQQQLHAAAKRYGKASIGDVAPDETLQKLQKQNAELQAALEESQKQCNGLSRQIERLQNEEPESLQELRAELAKEKASVSRMRFQLSKQLQDIGSTPESKDQPDREFAYKLQTLREHLREIHQEEKVEREQKGESLFGRISNLWKRVDDEY